MNDLQISPDTTPTASLANNSKLREQARHMYYSGCYVTEIVEALNIDINELSLYVFGTDGQGTALSCWAYMKLHRPHSSAVSYEKVKPFVLKSTEFKLLNLIRRGVDKLESDKENNLGMDDMSKAMGMIERLDKITRLEEGKATAISETTRKTYTLRDIQNARSDEDEEIEDAEFSDVVDDVLGAGEGGRDTPENTSKGIPTWTPPESDEGSRGE